MTTRPDACTVLVVDDDPIIRRLVRHGLAGQQLGEIIEAADGLEAQSILRERTVDLVITDLLMPGLDGMGLMRWANENSPGPTWIILSGVDTFDAAVEAIKVGAFNFLSKPPRLQELEVAVRNALEHRRLLAERVRLFSELEGANRQLARQVRELEEKSEIIRRDLERAEVIQRALLPAQPPPLQNHRVTTLYRPGLHVGGDLYHVTRIGERYLVVCVADATGHGVSSAMLSVLFHRRLALSDDAGRPLPPAATLERVNSALCNDRIAPGLFLTAVYCLLDLETQELRVASAGHPPALLRRQSGEVRRIRRTGPALGLTVGASYDEERERLGPGDRLLLFTDGLLQDSSDDEPWTVMEAAMSDADADGPARLQKMVDRLAEGPARREEQADDRDDTTVLLLEASPGPSHFDNGADTAGRRAAPPARSLEDTSLWYGESEDDCFLALRGRGTWTASDAFYETSLGILEAGRPLVIDLAACEYLDSTFLGTIHELVERAAQNRRGDLRLQGVHGTVRQAFEELSMEGVLRAADGPAAPLPADLQPLAGATAAGAEGKLRILRAHEALASLSPENQEKFRSVIETMRSQPGTPGG
jgi:serine phosphatase RsbU (regulator of sigma subunit)/anti-anti-sigma regulatory factor